MRLFAALPIFAVAFAAACESSTAPDRTRSDGLSPEFTPGAKTTECVGTLPPGSYTNIVVPANEFCIIGHSTVKGDILALEGSSLSLEGDNTVGGSIEANQATSVQMINPGLTEPNIVKHDIVLTGVTDGVFICGVRVTHGDIYIAQTNNHVILGGTLCNRGVGGSNIVEKGGLTVEDNFITDPFFGLVIGGNQVAKDLKVFRTTGNGAKGVGGNTVGHDLLCFDNDEPFRGGGFADPNIAKNFEGQCFP